MDSENQELNNQNPQAKKVKSNIWIKYVVTTASCLVATLIFIIIAGIFTGWETVYANTHWNINSELTKNMFILTNATFAIGMVCACFGLLVIAANGGVFEMLYYGTYRFFTLFKKDVNKVRFKTFYDYQVYRRGKPRRSFAHLLIVGVLFVALSGLFLAIYMQNI